jgi:hypothetical protein
LDTGIIPRHSFLFLRCGFLALGGSTTLGRGISVEEVVMVNEQKCFDGKRRGNILIVDLQQVIAIGLLATGCQIL